MSEADESIVGRVVGIIVEFERSGFNSRGGAKQIAGEQFIEDEKNEYEKAGHGLELARESVRQSQTGPIEGAPEMQEIKQRYIEHTGRPPRDVPRKGIPHPTMP